MIEEEVLTHKEKRRLVVLYRAFHDYEHDTKKSLQRTVRFIVKRIPEKAEVDNVELANASYWWKWELTDEQRHSYGIQYKFAAKEF